ncbi:hypothetical protein NC653_003196 [Populus alba x Populus x berolinensis]|uniref:Uncharacterized protein n=1 Tax=Populus alba x Populus x berolinensis TaxID=444605 RepID=A0AAD6WHW4_9ROSI|nr:hypothetical protein NC653_003196 [Populus alba x Populus x berolinensis]
MGSYYRARKDVTYLRCYKSTLLSVFYMLLDSKFPCIYTLPQALLTFETLVLSYHLKMSRELRSLCFLYLWFSSTVLFQSEARHLNGLKVASSSKNMEYSFTRLVLRGIKQSGPSQGGPGHRSGNAQLLGQPANSGPSPGVGHKYYVGMHY